MVSRSRLTLKLPAAFRRLCVETIREIEVKRAEQNQPPLGGCVLKQSVNDNSPQVVSQPPLGGCVLKLIIDTATNPLVQSSRL